MEVFQDVVLEFAQGAVEELGRGGFGAEEHAVDFCLGEYVPACFQTILQQTYGYLVEHHYTEERIKEPSPDLRCMCTFITDLTRNLNIHSK